MENHGKGARNVRVISTILDPAGKEVGKTASTPLSIPECGERTFEQQVVVKQPALWSLEERNLYKLVTEVESGGVITDRYETRFGIRDLQFDPDKGFFLNGKSVKVKGTCNHQDHAGVGVALPDAVQYFRVRKLQEMGCNALAHLAQPADAGAAGRLRRTGHAGARRDAHAVVESGRAGAVREHGPARPQPPERLPVVDGQRGEHFGDRRPACDPDVDEAGRA